MANDPDILVDLTTAHSATAAELIALFLRNEDIPAHVTAHAGATNPLQLGSTQPYRISVLRRDVERARQVLRAPPPPIDWESVDVGDPEPGDVIAVAAPAPREPHAWRRWVIVLVLSAFAYASVGRGALVFLGIAAIIEIIARFRSESRPAIS